ncbi:uncharacterized protein MELLADRAFT_117373 [Melampsora larici-populina 98AG31]|uniref:Origin recognition complex subunit 2 n=1 Tax=Melampsora larici-populina (strain 98AG31 / pathotype 3-4-7) TaxID=747676 RepID=F4RWI8_MELLP|nr:uncharacterized protein MELLADRAFT_117373 [Melampsora larici-populina 98AG31]EGG03291.1 hypothetical protein MELLADRAFT_117373 [Melampsora larici-populina 98AG31]
MSSSRTPTRSQSKKRQLDIPSPHSSPRKRSSPLKKSTSNLTPAKESYINIANEDETPKQSRTKRSVVFELNEEADSSTDEEEDADADLMVQMEDGKQIERGFLSSKNSEDAYFIAHSKIHPTSSNLFSSRPDWEPFTIPSYIEALDDTPDKNNSNTIHTSHTQRWPQWRKELENGFSLIFHGLGSKRVALNEFMEEALVNEAGWEGLVINGFQAGSQVGDVLIGIEEIVNQIDETSDGLVSGRLNSFEVLEARARKLCASLNTTHTPICVLIHNLDGRSFRNLRAQSILSMLAAQPNIHLLATIDHIYAPLILPSTLASARPDTSASTVGHLGIGACGYNFLYHHLPTYLPYTFESILDGTLSDLLPSTIFPPTVTGSNTSRSDVRQNGPATSKSIMHVLSSLTKKAKSLFGLLAQHQLQAYEGITSAQQITLDQHFKKGIPLDETPLVAMASRSLFEVARTDFVASVESQMSALLVEFRDHGIITGRREAPNGRDQREKDDAEMMEDDDEWLWIVLGKDELNEVIENTEDM